MLEINGGLKLNMKVIDFLGNNSIYSIALNRHDCFFVGGRQWQLDYLTYKANEL